MDRQFVVVVPQFHYEAPLVVDPHRVLTAPIAGQLLKVVAAGEVEITLVRSRDDLLKALTESLGNRVAPFPNVGGVFGQLTQVVIAKLELHLTPPAMAPPYAKLIDFHDMEIYGFDKGGYCVA
jgi:hypothetical protein